MRIQSSDAVNHIINSLDNTSATIWHDEEEDITWVVRHREDDVIEFEFIDGEGNESSQKFRLIEIA